MKLRLSILIICISISVNLSAQFYFIPIFIPNNNQYVSYDCPTRNRQADEYMQKGIENFGKNINLSILYFKGAIMKDSLFCDAYHGLTICFRKINEPDSALKYIDLALKVNSSNFWARRTKGFIYMDKSDYNLSAKYFREQFLKQPEESAWLYYLTRSLIEINQLDSAQRTALQMQFIMNQQQNIFSKRVGVYLLAKIAFKNGDYKAALKGYNLIHEYYRRDAEFCYFYGQCFLYTDKPNIRKAKRFIKKSKRLGYNRIDPELIDKLKI